MSRILFKILLTALLVTSTNLYAHSYHSHGKKAVSEEKAILSANASVKRLVTEGKLEKSWSGIKHSSIEKKTYTKKKKEWLVVYKNMDVKRFEVSNSPLLGYFKNNRS